MLRSRPSRRTSIAQALARNVRPAHLALTRTGVGAVMLARPRLLPQVLGVDSAASARTSWVVQMLGAREVAMGLGGLAAGRRRDARLWIAAGALSDAVDALVIGSAAVRGRLSRPLAAAVSVSALGAAAAGLAQLSDDGRAASSDT